MSAQSPPTQRDHIFISYRRDDASGASGRIYDWLRIGFGRERVFRDEDSIGVGKWGEEIDAVLAKSAACVAVIGPRWADSDNLPRLHKPDDTLRHELVSAMACADIKLVPTLVEGAPIPPLADLPADLRPLFDWNAHTVSEGGWEDDIRRLIAEIAVATRLPVGPDLDTLLHDVAAARQRIAELEQAHHHDAQQIESLHGTIDDLQARLADASGGERPALANAFAELARGNTLAAEDAFEREYEAQVRLADQARRNQAEAARNVANLALLRDVTKAADYYRKALNAEPQHAETARQLGRALIALGDIESARTMFTRSLESARAAGDSWGEMAAQGGLGDIFRASGDLAAANSAYTATLRLAEQRLATDPANTEWQRDLSISHDRIGDVRRAQGDGPGALAAFRTSLAIREALAARDPANTEWQRDLSISHIKAGDLLRAHGDGPAALAAYRESLAIAETLAARDPANTQWQRDLSISHIKTGDTLRARGDGPAALAAFRKGLAIVEALAARDPANTGWQHDLSVSFEKIGDVLLAQGDGPGALAAFRKGLAIREALAARDPANTEWQRDLSVSHNRIGEVLLAQGDGPAALAAFRKGLDIREALAARDPANTEWQRDLSVSHNRTGEVLLAQGDGPGALAAFRKCFAIHETLAARDPANTGWQRDLSVSCEKIGGMLLARRDGPGALAAFRKCLAIHETLVARDPANTGWQRDLSVSFERIGDVLLAQDDGPAALAAFRNSHAIAEALAARDPLNARWQRDLIVSFVKLGEATGDASFAARALGIAQAMQQRGILAPRDAWMIDELKRRAGK